MILCPDENNLDHYLADAIPFYFLLLKPFVVEFLFEGNAPYQRRLDLRDKATSETWYELYCQMGDLIMCSLFTILPFADISRSLIVCRCDSRRFTFKDTWIFLLCHPII